MDEFDFTQSDWEQGITLPGLIEVMEVNREAMARRYHAITLTVEEKARLAGLTAPRKLLVLTEEWCSDCLMNLPILAKIVEAAPASRCAFSSARIGRRCGRISTGGTFTACQPCR